MNVIIQYYKYYWIQSNNLFSQNYSETVNVLHFFNYLHSITLWTLIINLWDWFHKKRTKQNLFKTTMRHVQDTSVVLCDTSIIIQQEDMLRTHRLCYVPQVSSFNNVYNSISILKFTNFATSKSNKVRNTKQHSVTFRITSLNNKPIPTPVVGSKTS